MVGACGHDDGVCIAHQMFLRLVEDELRLTLLDAEKLIDVRVHFLADLFAPSFPVPIGVLEDIEAPIYEDVMLQQEQRAISERGPGSIAKLLTSGDTWKIG